MPTGGHAPSITLEPTMSPTRAAVLRRAPVRGCFWAAAAIAILPMAGAAQAQGSAPYGHNFKLSREEQRKAKLDAIEAWSAP
jgi:hypothetical protein